MAAAPAIDKREDLDDVSAENEQKNKTDIQDVVGWVLEALDAQKIKMIPLEEVKPQAAASVIRESLADGDNQSILYRSVLTDEKAVGLCIVNLRTEDQYAALRKVLQKYRASASFFLTAEADPALTGQIAENGYSPENGGKTGKSFRDAGKMYEEIEGGKDALLEENISSEAYLVRDEACIPEIRTACFVSGQIPVFPQNPEKLSEGSLYLFDASDLDQVELLLDQAQKRDFSVEDVHTLLGKKRDDSTADGR